ncbi:MAG: DivIVA domain-containing protein [bacterium]
MKFSPLDIYNKEFTKSTFGGYKAEEVEDFLEDVGRAFEKTIKELNNVKDEKEKLEEKLKNYENIEDKLEQTLLSVQETAKVQTEQAKNEANMIIEKANMKAKKIIDEAKIKIREEQQALENLKEVRELFEIRFESLLKSHLKLLEKDDQFEEIDDIIENNFENTEIENNENHESTNSHNNE